jgi:hypothetical protein
MTRTLDDEIAADLRDLFDRQAGAMRVENRVWDAAPMVTTNALASRRRSRPALAAVVSLAAAVALVVGVVAIAPGGNGVYIAGQPGSPSAVRFATPQVRLAADSLQIDAGGQHFSAGGSTVVVNSDPGTPDKYTTLELTWKERGVEMRLNIYFASEGLRWWANEIRTYNGKSPGDWIEYTGTFFRTPLGRAFAGNVDLRADDGHGRLRLTNLRLQPFLPPAACTNSTTPYALNPLYDRIDIPTGADGFGIGVTQLLDTASCSAVADPHLYEYDWTITDTAVVKIDIDAEKPPRSELLGADPTARMDVAPIGHGQTDLHVVARRKSNGEVVATADIPVTVA